MVDIGTALQTKQTLTQLSEYQDNPQSSNNSFFKIYNVIKFNPAFNILQSSQKHGQRRKLRLLVVLIKMHPDLDYVRIQAETFSSSLGIDFMFVPPYPKTHS